MLSAAGARELVTDLARAAVDGGAEDWALGAARLSASDGRTWLLLDEAARAFTYAGGTAVSGVKGWLGTNLADRSGFVAAITSFHADGRIRQRATQLLIDAPPHIRAAALAVRCLDHVPQVRHEALGVLLNHLDLQAAEPALGVLLAGRHRHHAQSAVGAIQAALPHTADFPTLFQTLFASRQREVRRWIFDVAHERDELNLDPLLRAVTSDPDQLIRAKAAAWLPARATSVDLRALLRARSVQARLTGLTHLSDGDLPDGPLSRCWQIAPLRCGRPHSGVPTGAGSTSSPGTGHSSLTATLGLGEPRPA